MLQSLLHSVEKYGNKLANTVAGGLHYGQKALGTVSHYGHKVVDPMSKGIDMVRKIPGVGAIAQPVLAPVGAAIGVVKSGLGVVDGAASAMGAAASGIRAAQSAIKAGDKHAAINVIRDTAHDSFAASKTLKSSAQNALERGKRL